LKAQLALQDNGAKEAVTLQDKARKDVETLKEQLALKEESICTHCDVHRDRHTATDTQLVLEEAEVL
jgi:GTP cyclohydrolase III